MKYKAKLHINADKEDVEFIGFVEASSIKRLKENARQHARSWNKHMFGRIHIEEEETQREWYVNP